MSPCRYDGVLPRPRVSWGDQILDVDDLDAVLGQARRCAVGQGPLTRYDPAVRDAWEVPGDELEVRAPAGLSSLLDRASAALRLGGAVQASLDKLVIYGPDGSFAPHRDTLRSDGHVATLVLRLRTAERGGRLWVGERRPVPDPAPHGGDEVACTVFHADVPHRIEPVVDGWRVALVYQVHRAGPAALPGPDEAAATHHATGHTPDGGEVAMLAHRYSEAALRAGALVGDDRALVARWRQEDADARIALGTLEGRLEQEYTSALSIRVRPLHPAEAEPLAVHPTIRLVGSLDHHPAAGGYAMWTGNEGTQVVRRYRAGAAVRWPGAPALERHPELTTCLDVVGGLAPKLLEALDEHLDAVGALADELRCGSWREPLLDRLDAEVDPAVGVQILQDQVERWLDVVRRLQVPYPQELLRLQETPDDALVEAGPAAVAAHAQQQGWTRLQGPMLTAASDELLRGADEVMFDLWRGRDTQRLVDAKVRRLTIYDTDEGVPTVDLPPLAQLEELTVHAPQSLQVDLARLPRLQRLTAHAEVTNTAARGAQPSLFGPDEEGPGNLVHADLVVQGRVPPAVCRASLRVLRVRPAVHEALALAPLRGATGLRRLVLDGVRTIDDLPWAQLPSSLTHLHIVRRTTTTAPLHLPPAAQRVLDGLEELVLDGVGLGEVRLGRCTRLHTLHLSRCAEVHGPLPVAQLRSLKVVDTAVPLPVELPLLETLRVQGPGRTFELATVSSRLRELHLAHLHHAELTELGAAADLRHLVLDDIAHLHLATGLTLPALESLTLRRLPVSEVPLVAPGLRALHVDDLPLEALPDAVVPELCIAELHDLPLTDLPTSWQHSPLQRLVLDRLPHLRALPAWLASCRSLEVLRACHGALRALPPLAALASLRQLVLVDQPLVIDQAFATNVRSAPSLVWLELAWAGGHEERTPDIEGQLRGAGYQPPAPAPAPGPPWVDDDDIPF